MKIVLEPDDSADFIGIVQGLVNGLLVRETPPSLRLIKTDNWFGSKWLGFSGKKLGAFGVSMDELTIPPFVPNRILSERTVVGPPYIDVLNDRSLHMSVASSIALTRRAGEFAPGAILMWYSGGSISIGRGSVMAYIPTEDVYSTWYTEWASSESWRLVKRIGIQPDDLSRLMTDRRAQ